MCVFTSAHTLKHGWLHEHVWLTISFQLLARAYFHTLAVSIAVSWYSELSDRIRSIWLWQHSGLTPHISETLQGSSAVLCSISRGKVANFAFAMRKRHLDLG